MYDASAEHRQVRLIANRLLSWRWKSGQDLWKMQEDLLKLQRDIQAKISEEKRKPARDIDRVRLQTLREARWHARHLGDTLAWLLLGLNRQLISSLSENTRVPISEDGHGAVGVMAMAQHLNAIGWGFPLLHDITDYLRIGDITFIRPSRTPEHVTVEIKTRLVEGGEPNEDGSVENRYETTVYTMVGIDPMTGDPDPSRPGVPPARTDPPKNRFQRQAVRMRDAAVKAQAGHGMISDISKPALNLHLDVESKDHWPTVKRLIRDAHRNGAATEVVDGAFVYCVLYQEGGLTPEAVAASPLAEAVQRPEFINNKDPAESAVVVQSVPRAKDDKPLHIALPYFLFPISRSAIFELLNGELHIVVLVNEGRICDVLREHGFEVEARPWGGGGRREIVVIDRFEAGGEQFFAEVHTMWHLLRDACHEFRSIDYIVDHVKHMIEGMRPHAINLGPGQLR